MDRLPSDPLSNVLAFLTVNEAGRVANTCKGLRNVVEKHKFTVHLHIRDLKYGKVCYGHWEDFNVMTKEEAVKKAIKLKNKEHAFKVCVRSEEFAPIGYHANRSKLVFQWRKQTYLGKHITWGKYGGEVDEV